MSIQGRAIVYHEKGDVNTLKLETKTFRELEEHEVLMKVFFCYKYSNLTYAQQVHACGVCYRDILDRYTNIKENIMKGIL
jgi:hypothetical protein